jgi:hypothetical protein
MKPMKILDEEAIVKRAIDVLMKELGPIETVRFITVPKKKRMESVKRHREWQKYLGKDHFFQEVFAK